MIGEVRMLSAPLRHVCPGAHHQIEEFEP
jgi:hypothetical protein